MTDDLDARIAQLQGLIGADEQALQPQQWGQQGQGSVFAGGQQQQQGFGGGFQRQGGDEKAPPRFAKDADDRSIFIAGLPKQDETAEELAQLFAPCGPIAKVTLLRDHTTNNLKGTAYIEFQTFEGAGRALDTMQQVQFRGAHALTVCTYKTLGALEKLSSPPFTIYPSTFPSTPLNHLVFLSSLLYRISSLFLFLLNVHR